MKKVGLCCNPRCRSSFAPETASPRISPSDLLCIVGSGGGIAEAVASCNVATEGGSAERIASGSRRKRVVVVVVVVGGGGAVVAVIPKSASESGSPAWWNSRLCVVFASPWTRIWRAPECSCSFGAS